jgi:hypothetical protein
MWMLETHKASFQPISTRNMINTQQPFQMIQSSVMSDVFLYVRYTLGMCKSGFLSWHTRKARNWEQILRQYTRTIFFSVNLIDLIVNLMELPDIRQLRRHLPNDLPTDS